MLEFIFALLTMGHATETRAFARALVGGSYDSRILIAPDSMFDQGRPTKFGDYRVNTNADLSYWAVVSGRHHWGLVGGAALTNTAQNKHAAGDPYRFSVGLPYLLEFDGTHPHQLLIRPVVQTLLMDPALTTRKMVVQNSALLDVNSTWHTGVRWDTMVGLEYRRDDATTRQSVGHYDADANKFTARGRVTYWPGDRRRRSLAFDLAAIRNQARGRYAQYDRAEAGVIFAAPLMRDLTYTVGVGAYRLNFPAAEPRRRDLNLNASAGLRVPLGGPWAFEGNAAYARNLGRDAPFKYDRFTILTALSLATPL